MDNNYEYNLSGSQMSFISSEKEQVLFCGGLGSGKTFSGAVWAVKMLLEHPTAKGLITANSYSQLKKATLPELFKQLDFLGISYTFKQNSNVLEVNGTIIYCISMEKYDLLRGIEVGWAWSDECAFYRKEAFDVLMGRIRDKNGPCIWKGTTTPNGFNWLYDWFVVKPAPGKEVVYSKTMDNADNLPESYIRRLKEQYDDRLAKQELDGAFVNLNSGSVYYSFDRQKHVRDIQLKDTDRIFVGLDFNVHPLCGILCVQRGSMLYIFDEIYLENSNTFQAAKEIIKRYPVIGRLDIIADETGNRRKSSSQTTDHEILRRAGLRVIPFKNPRVKDRQNNVNRLIAKGNVRIDPKCKNLIQDLERLTYNNDDDMLSHISDALGYVFWKLDPLQKVRRAATVRY